MTLHATRDRDKGTLTFYFTYGPIQAHLEEAEGHALSFWHSLGALLAPDVEDRAKAGYERYMAHSHLVNETAFTHRTWTELDEGTRSHWIAAFTE